MGNLEDCIASENVSDHQTVTPLEVDVNASLIRYKITPKATANFNVVNVIVW